MRCRERTVLFLGAGQGHTAGGVVVHVDDRHRGGTGHAFNGTGEVGVVGDDPHLVIHFILCQDDALFCGARKVGPGGTIGRNLPLIADGAQPVDIVQCMTGGE